MLCNAVPILNSFLGRRDIASSYFLSFTSHPPQRNIKWSNSDCIAVLITEEASSEYSTTLASSHRLPWVMFVQ